MSRIALTGVISCLLGLLTLGYQGLKALMDSKTGYQTVHIIDLFDTDFIDRLDSVHWHGWQWAADWFLDLPLFAVCFVVGAVFLLISTFLWRR